MTVTRMAVWLGLREPVNEKSFNFELPDEITAVMSEVEVAPELLKEGNMLSEVPIPPRTLVVMVKRDGNFLVPTGKTRLFLGDRLLLISEDEKHLRNLVAVEG